MGRTLISLRLISYYCVTSFSDSWSGKISISNTKLLSRCIRCLVSLRYCKVWIELIRFSNYLCFVSSRDSYNAVANWLADARSLASPNIVIVLCGNKKDLEDQRQVTFLEASRFAQENGNVNWIEKKWKFRAFFRFNVHRNICGDGWKCYWKFSQMCTCDSEQNRFRYFMQNAQWNRV